MCERAKNEPLLQYWFRQFKEEPLRVCIVATTAATVWLYQDGNKQWEQYRQDMREQQALLVEQITKTNDVLRAVEGRLSSCENSLHHLEREHEQSRNSEKGRH
jgi:hypothetical protein